MVMMQCSDGYDLKSATFPPDSCSCPDSKVDMDLESWKDQPTRDNSPMEEALMSGE